MRSRSKPEGDKVRRLDRMVSSVLAVGLALAIVLMVTGTVLALVGRGPSLPSKTMVADLPSALASLESGGFLGLGLLILLATPVARVAALMVGFGRAKSWVFCCMGALVLALLALSAYLGLTG